MVIDENEDGISKDSANVLYLVVKVPDWSVLSSILGNVVNGAWIHASNSQKSQNGCHYLKHLCVLNVSKWETKWEEGEHENAQVVGTHTHVLVQITRVLFFSTYYESDSFNEAFSPTDILETHCSIHVNDENDHNKHFQPLLSMIIRLNAQFNLLSHIIWRILNECILLVVLFHFLPCLVSLLGEKCSRSFFAPHCARNWDDF